jgi:hypothetical protein
MDGLLNFSLAFLLVAFALLVLLGKADAMMTKFKLVKKDGKLKFVAYRRYDVGRTRPLYALVLFLLAVFILLEYLLRPLPEYAALILIAVLLPILLYMELRCRIK